MLIGIHFPKNQAKVFDTIGAMAMRLGTSPNRVVLGIVIDFFKVHEVLEFKENVEAEEKIKQALRLEPV